MYCLLFLVVFNALLDSSIVDSKLLGAEPLVIIKSLLEEPSSMQIQAWQKFKNLNQTSTQIGLIQAAIESMVQTRAVMKVDGNGVTVLNLPQAMQMSSVLSIPYTNILTFITTSLKYLLEGFTPEVLQKPLGDLDFESDIVIPNNLKHDTLFDLFNKIPQYNLNQIGLVNEMNTFARTAFLVVRDLLEKNHKDGWHDAFLSSSLDNAMLTGEQGIEAPLNDLAMFAQSVLYDLKLLDAVSINKLPQSMQGNEYAFGWWLNCARTRQCLTGLLPRDAIISLSPALRIYIIPSLETGFVIANLAQRTHNTRTFKELIDFDTEIFTRILRVVEGQGNEQQQQQQQQGIKTEDLTLDSIADRQGDRQQQKEDNETLVDDDSNEILGLVFRTLKKYVVLYMEFTARQHLFVRALLWILFLLLAHLFTAWMYHGIWWTVCKLVKRTHEPRPKRE